MAFEIIIHTDTISESSRVATQHCVFLLGFVPAYAARIFANNNKADAVRVGLVCVARLAPQPDGRNS